MKPNVLVVDDSATIRHMIKRTMQMARLCVGDVYEASNGIEALAMLDNHDITVMIVDINMPTMNGIQLLQRMKQNTRLKSIPIVIASTEGSEERMEQLRAMGALAYVRKPFQPEQLRQILQPLLGVTDENDTAAAVTGDTLF